MRSRGERLARAATVATVAGTLGLGGAVLLPWVSSGRTPYSGVALARSVQRLGLAPGPAGRAGSVLLVLVPSLAVAVALAAAVGRRSLVATLGGLTSLVATSAYASVRSSPLQLRAGAHAAAVAAGVALAGAGVLAGHLVLTRRRRP